MPPNFGPEKDISETYRGFEIERTRGRYDGYYQSNLNLWDIAAGLIIIKEAGGIINDIDLKNHKNLNVIASSPNINDKFIKKISNF